MADIIRSLQSNILGEVKSLDSGVFTTTNTSPTDVTNLSVTITTIGRPVLVAVVASGAAAALIGLNNTSAAALNGEYRIVRDTVPPTSQVTVCNYPLVSTLKSGIVFDQFAPAAAVWAVDWGVKGLPNTYQYKMQIRITVPGSGTARVENAMLMAFQIEA